MTIKEISLLINQELLSIYPATERESITFLILNHLLGFKRFDIHQKADEEFPGYLNVQIYNIIEQLKDHKPIQYVLGETEFYGLPFYVDSSVLIPRPETEELVQWIISDYENTSPRIIDIGTGSGCIPVALARHIPDAFVIAIDISEEALATAAKNAAKNDADVHFMKVDFLSEKLPELGAFDVIVSNPPYVTQKQKSSMEANVLNYEPHLALFVPDDDPLIFYKAVAKFAKKNIRKGGCIYLEINETLAQETSQIFLNLGHLAELRKDINGKYRMLKVKFK